MFPVFRPREWSESVGGDVLEWAKGRIKNKMVQLFSESDAVSSLRVAFPNEGHGVSCHVPPLKVPSKTLVRLVLAGVTGEDDVLHQR